MENNLLDQRKKRSKKDYLSLLVRITISTLALLYLALRVDWGMFLQNLQTMNLIFVALAFISVIASIVVSAYKWFILCKLHGHISFNECFRWYYIGFFLNNFLPGSIGGDVGRVYFAGKKLGTQQAIASVTVERVFAGIALALCSFAGILYFSVDDSPWMQIFIFVVILTAIYCFLFVRPFQNMVNRLANGKIKPFYDSVALYKQKKGTLIKLFVFSFLFQLCYILVSSFLFLAMDVSVPFLAQIGFISLISILTMIPISINGLGIREGAYVLLFAMVGVAESTSLAVSLMFFILVLIATSIGGIVWIFEKNKEKSHFSKYKEQSL